MSLQGMKYRNGLAEYNGVPKQKMAAEQYNLFCDISVRNQNDFMKLKDPCHRISISFKRDRQRFADVSDLVHY